MSHAHQDDFHAWALEQAALLRAGRFAAADIENIAEEIESMGRGEKRDVMAGGVGTLLLRESIRHLEGVPSCAAVGAKHATLQTAALIDGQPNRSIWCDMKVTVEAAACSTGDA